MTYPPPDSPKDSPSLRTTTVGSYPIPDWLRASPSEQALVDATRVVFDLQRQAGIDLPTDGELYRFDVNHPDTNGMIDYFARRLGGCTTAIGRSRSEAWSRKREMSFRSRPAAVVTEALGEGSLNLLQDCQRAASVAGGDFKLTLTSPYMLARSLMDEHYRSLESLTIILADILASQVKDLPAACLQVDEAHLPGNPEHSSLAATSINLLLDNFQGETGVHLCFGNYGGQTIQKGDWKTILEFLNSLNADHLVLEMARRPLSDLEALKDVRAETGLGIGVVDIKINHVESAEEIARRIEEAVRILGLDRLRYIHPDCGFWMLNRSIADRKIAALAKGRDLFLGRIG